MQYSTIITEEKLHQQSDYAESQGLIPELLFRLILASVGNPKELRIPFGGSVNQPGLDALLISPFEFDPYIPEGKSLWEIGTGHKPQNKATEDFTMKTKELSGSDRAEITYIAFTSRSGCRAWNEPDQRKWRKNVLTKDYQQQWIELEEKRIIAIKKILEIYGMEEIFSFYETVTNVRMVGVAFGKVATPEHDIKVLPQFLGSNEDKKQLFISGYVMSRFDKDGWQWADDVAKTAWSEDVIIEFLTLLPFTPETWQRAEQLLGDKEKNYWHKADPRTLREENFITDAIEKLLKYGRPIAAIACLSRMLHVKKTIPIEQAFQALIYDQNSKEVIKEPLNHYSCTEIIKWLQSNAGQENERLFLVEWRYLPLLDRHYGLIPLTLEKYLVERPDFFCQVIQLVFHSKNEEVSIAESSEEKKRIAENAYDLLYKWRKIPGSDANGTIDDEVLKNWVKEVKKRCEESGHLQIALDQIGKVLAHAPEDPEGLWIHNAVANVLNEKDHDAMRAAFTCELFNERGVHGWTGGTEEIALAKEYRKKAKMVDQAGYFRLAGALRELAESYERYGKMEEDDPLER